MTTHLWYIDLSVNNHNSRAYQDMISDMRTLKNGVYSATLRLNQGCVTDYVHMKNAYGKSTKTSQNIG